MTSPRWALNAPRIRKTDLDRLGINERESFEDVQPRLGGHPANLRIALIRLKLQHRLPDPRPAHIPEGDSVERIRTSSAL